MLLSLAASKFNPWGIAFAIIGGAMMLLAKGNPEVSSAGHDLIVAGITLSVVKPK